MPDLKTLISNLDAKKQKTVRNALRGLIAFEKKGKAALPAVERVARSTSRDAKLRGEAVHIAHVVAGKSALPFVVEMTEDPEPIVRAFAALTLARSNDKSYSERVQSVFSELADSSDSFVQGLVKLWQDEHGGAGHIADVDFSIETKAMGQLKVTVKVVEEEPSVIQQAALSSIREIDAEKISRCQSLIEEHFDDDDDEPHDVEFFQVIVPPLHESSDFYFFLIGDSDIDPEHGIAILCRNGDKFAVCPSDFAYENHAADNQDEFDQFF